MSTREEFEETLVSTPSSVCRECGYGPCACGKRDHRSDLRVTQDAEREAARGRDEDPMDPFVMNMDDF